MLGMLMQMLLGQTGSVAGPSKNEIDDGATTSPWTNLLTVGLRVLTAFLGGPQQPVDGIDKVDNQSSPMQVGENNHDVPLFVHRLSADGVGNRFRTEIIVTVTPRSYAVH